MHIIQGLFDTQLLFYLQNNITADIYRAITAIIFLECPKVKCLASIHTHAARGLFIISSSVPFNAVVAVFFCLLLLALCLFFFNSI